MMTKREIVKKLEKDLGIYVAYITFAVWEMKGIIKTNTYTNWVGRKVKAYTNEDYQNIKKQIIDLILKGKIHPKGWENIKYAAKKQKTKRKTT